MQVCDHETKKSVHVEVERTRSATRKKPRKSLRLVGDLSQTKRTCRRPCRRSGIRQVAPVEFWASRGSSTDVPISFSARPASASAPFFFLIMSTSALPHLHPLVSIWPSHVLLYFLQNFALFQYHHRHQDLASSTGLWFRFRFSQSILYKACHQSTAACCMDAIS